MGFDVGAMLLGILYRDNKSNEWLWTVVEEKNIYNNLIINNLNLIYDTKTIIQRPNDKNIKYELKNNGEQYIIDQNIEKLSVGLGWDLSSPYDSDDDDQNERLNSKKKQKVGGFDIDIDVDGSIMVFSKIEVEENEKGLFTLKMTPK